MTDQEFTDACHVLRERLFPTDTPIGPTGSVEVDADLLREMMARHGSANIFKDAYRERLIGLCRYAATCEDENTPEWLWGLLEQLNRTCNVLGDDTRFMVRDGRIVKA